MTERLGDEARTPHQLLENVGAPAFRFEVVCHDEAGQEKWREDSHNLVTTAGKTALLAALFSASSWYMGIIAGSGTPAIAASDTLASHAGWTELSGYAGNRPPASFGSFSGGSVNATASFSINTTATMGGMFLASVALGNSGTLYDAALFAGGNRSVQPGDTLTVTATEQAQ